MSKICIPVLILALARLAYCVDLKLIEEWRELEFSFPNSQLRQLALDKGLYQPGNSLPIDVDVDYRPRNASRIFVTIPRFSQGVPMTLTTVTRQTAANGPVLAPYPDYSWHSSHGRNCNGLTSVFRVAIDKCNRLWVLDSGLIETTQHCPPQLLAFNLETDKLLMRYRFPPDQYKCGSNSLFITPIVDLQDTKGKCRDTFVYIADVSGQGLIVFDLRNERSWRINNKLFYPNPEFGTFTIQGESFDLMDGIFGMALSPLPQSPQQRYGFGPWGNHGNNAPNPLTPRTMYFHSLANNVENVVNTSDIQNASLWLDNPDASPRLFQTLGTRLGQSTSKAMDRRGNLFFGMVNPIAIACWDSSTPYEPNNLHIVAQNDETLQFASGVKVIDNLDGTQELWVLTCRLQKLMNGSLNNQTVNYRILALQTDGLLGSGGRCTGNGFSQRSNVGYLPLIFSN